ncbi:DJ-1/PfpI family protein [Bacillus horti]|uniref:Intracellular protease/amidase n=1 Tax=Caldalkalibacillus horti TaxID=77523 RepID=A0ABT9VUC6_9BACI|nr:DJ-1/PfpI family protein [Bacillus horti]MDQ0164589.1 putative intracellular protease/amidase [Bacillus horti]
MKRAAFIAYDDCAIWQVALLQRFLRKAEWEVTTITLDGKDVITDGGMKLKADTSLSEIDLSEYHLLLFPGAGGKVPEQLLGSEKLHQLINSFKGLIAASCASALFVAAAGLLKDRTFTTNEVIMDRYSVALAEGNYVDQDVCADHNLITSKGYAHVEFMRKVLEELGLMKQDPRLENMTLKLGKNQ